ncbi:MULTISPECIES: DEAD/DEAH box helicase [unclassified Granulicatella]|uniref:DEAD/DEAH box helicase n=1 Tax=unclassified Granulicatella TaxID=2630493 RepID=UPI001073C178|nr:MULTISPECIES: DEAD/DEAH box helicase [unclassified Granulicatella]MBF0780936.1 DEAD/DEAH box helicase [Granulicatella sp. 19428wC4_WM01]TFU92998.1 hypothetical protein E4T68_07455 [Granulicatella sp. WM01]
MCAKLDNKVIEHAKTLVAQNRVINAIKYAASKVWFAEVLDGMQLYDVYLDTTGNHQDSCSCHEFKQKHYCRHSVAVELYLNVKGYENIRQTHLKETVVPTHYINQFNKEMYYLLDTMERKNELVFSQNANVHLDCQVCIDYELGKVGEVVKLSLKIGKEKYYTIKQFHQFSYEYTLKMISDFGSREQINWQYDALGHVEHAFLEWLFELFEQESIVQYGKYLMIPPEHVVTLFEKIKALPNATIIFQQNTFPISAYQSETKFLHINIEEHEEQLVLKLLNQHIHLFEKMQLLCIDDVFCHVSFQKMKIYKKVLKLFKRMKQKEVYIPQTYISDFIDYTLPLLSQIAHINDSFMKKVSQESPDVLFSVDVHDLSVYITIDYHYPQAEYVQRDVTLENQINRCLYQLGIKNLEKFCHTHHELYHFLSYDLKYLEKFGSVQLPKDFQNIFLEHVTLDIEITRQGGLLDISFDIDGISQYDIEHILKHIKEKSTFYELSDGRMLPLETEEFSKVHHILDNIRGKYSIKNGTVQLHQTQALSIVDKLDDAIKDDSFRALIHDLTHPETFPVSIPKTLKATLKPYQEYGFKWLKMLSYHKLGGILADDMGLGKTIQAITYLLSEYEQNNMRDKKALIVAPASLIFNWQCEFEKFAPNLVVRVVSGTKHERISMLKDKSIDVFMTSYQSFRRDMLTYYDQEWHVVILDESQLLKNATTKIHHSLRDITADFMFALSGTPIENRKEDFWSIYSLILPGLFPTIKEFRQLSDETIAKIARPFLLRRLKKDVLTELPDKLETVMYSELTKEQKVIYVGYLQRMQEQIRHYSEQDMVQHRFDILSGLTRLRQICCHPDLFVENYVGKSGKLEQFLNLVGTAISNGHRLLVFSQFSKMLTILEKELQERHYKTLLLTGKTPVNERLHLVNEFNEGTYDVFLLSLKVGGTGLNLTGADTIILYDLWWNPAVEEQAMSRAHRMGQKNTVQVYRMVSQGTIEEKMLHLQQKKKELFESVVGDENNVLLNRQNLTSEDIKDILGL